MIIAFVLISCNRNANDTMVVETKPLQDILDSLKLDKAKIALHIDKSDYRLHVMIDTLVVKSYPVVFGFNPVDDKMREGDGCTPEGTFELIDLYPHAKWSKFMWISYPNAESKWKYAANMEAGLISPTDGIGGEIGIHGTPDGRDDLIDDRKNWTLGCIALKNKDVNEIYSVVKVGTRVEIVK